MPYKCVHCSSVYQDGSQEMLKGCSQCKSKFFFYIREDKLKQLMESKNYELDLTNEEKEQIENDVRDIAGIENEETPVFLDFESVRILKPGKYILDLQKLFSMDKPRIYQLEDGKYIIDIMSPLKKRAKAII